ncbi:MAG: hypothetical protein HQK86_11600 [Nitrospinae bacterium]|nr:hypothetical protein [Nitrospinota bacterium]
MSEPFIKKTPALQGGGGARKDVQFSPKIITQMPEPPTPLYCFGHAHEPYERGDCSTCPKASPCALITPIWIQHEDRLRRRSRRNLVDTVHRKFGYPRRMLAAEYSDRYDI